MVSCLPSACLACILIRLTDVNAHAAAAQHLPFNLVPYSALSALLRYRRWNNTVGLTLRALVYDPIVERRLLPAPHGHAATTSGKATSAAAESPSAWLRALGLAATFAVSGLMHEIILYSLVPSGLYVGGYWFAFFFVQAPLLAVEAAGLRWLRRSGRSVPRLLGMVYVHALVLTAARFAWFPPIETHSDVALTVLSSVNTNAAAAAATVGAAAAAAGLPRAPAALAALFNAASSVVTG